MKLLALCVVAACLAGGAGAWGAEPAAAEVRPHNGRGMVFINGKPHALPTYSTVGWMREAFGAATPRFFPHRMGAYFIVMPRAEPKQGAEDFFLTPFWHGDRIANSPLADVLETATPTMDEQADLILKGDPGAWLLVRFGPNEPRSWRDLHGQELFVNEDGQVVQAPSAASERYWQDACRYTRAVIEHCESRPWSSRIIGYWNGLRCEGTGQALIEGWLFDHGPRMTERWRRFLRRRYRTVEDLRGAWGDPKVTFESAPVPKDKLRGPLREVSALPYWQGALQNQPLRDYLELQRDLFHEGFRLLAGATRRATDRKRVLLYDAFKQSMLGWDNLGFFDPKASWPLAYHGMMAGSGHIDVTGLFDAAGFDGIVTPHDYQARGIGGHYEPEGMADSAILRGKAFFCEMDVRTWTARDKGEYFAARDDREFAAITWRNVAASLARGFNSYYMDLWTDWFATESMHRVIDRQVQVIRESVDWPHETVPGIAMVLDDAAALETSGDGRFLNEAVMWEQKTGLARCGVPYRIYMLDDLRLDSFPRHRVFYFPNLFRVTDERLKLLGEKVFRDGNVVLWGPGSGISDGRTLGPQHAAKLTGFALEYWPVNYPRRVQVHDYAHPITRGLDEGAILGSPLAFGPMLFPKDGHALGMAWTKQGRTYAGLAVKTFGRGAAGTHKGKEPLGKGDWASVFTTAVPIPANMWRGLARFAGAHVYCESNDVLIADSTIVALHSIRSGHKTIRLPRPSRVFDVISGNPGAPGLAEPTDKIEFDLEAPATRVFRVEPPGRGRHP